MPKKATPKELSEIVTGHQAQLQKIASNWAAGINKEISATDSELIRYIQEQLKSFGTVGLDKKTEGRFMQMEKDIRAIRKQGYDDAYTYIAEQTGTLASNEAKWAGAYTTALTGDAVKKIMQDAISNLAKFGSYNGHTIQEWFTNIADKEVFNILGVARNGLANGESLSTMVGRIMGTPGIKGILDTSRVEATALARTACNGVANDAKAIFYEANQDVIVGYRFVATLDFKTCLVKGTKILGNNGLINIENIKTGDIVIGGSRKPQRVLGTRIAKTKKLAKVTLSNGEIIYSTPDHLYFTENGWIEAKDLNNGDRLEQSL